MNDITRATRATRVAIIDGRFKEATVLMDALGIQLEQFYNRHPLPRLMSDVAELRHTVETIDSMLENLRRLVDEELHRSE